VLQVSLPTQEALTGSITDGKEFKHMRGCGCRLQWYDVHIRFHENTYIKSYCEVEITNLCTQVWYYMPSILYKIRLTCKKVIQFGLLPFKSRCSCLSAASVQRVSRIHSSCMSLTRGLVKLRDGCSNLGTVSRLSRPIPNKHLPTDIEYQDVQSRNWTLTFTYLHI
jgi:hypothetical protein